VNDSNSMEIQRENGMETLSGMQWLTVSEWILTVDPVDWNPSTSAVSEWVVTYQPLGVEMEYSMVIPTAVQMENGREFVTETVTPRLATQRDLVTVQAMERPLDMASESESVCSMADWRERQRVNGRATEKALWTAMQRAFWRAILSADCRH